MADEDTGTPFGNDDPTDGLSIPLAIFNIAAIHRCWSAKLLNQGRARQDGIASVKDDRWEQSHGQACWQP